MIEDPDQQFTQREQDVLALLLLGRSNQQIALELGIAARTVEFHLGNIYEKLGVASRTEAIVALSGQHLWKPTGEGISDNQGISAVEGKTESSQNGYIPILRRIPMKNLIKIIGGSVSTIVFAVMLLLSRLPEKKPEAIVPMEPTPHTLIEESTEVPAITEVAFTPEPTPQETEIVIEAAEEFTELAVAHFVDENYPDGSSVEKSASFIKTWVFRNDGTTSWTPEYALVITGVSAPLASEHKAPDVISMPQEVKPGELVTLSANFTAPNTDGIFEVHYKLVDQAGNSAEGNGSEVWLSLNVGEYLPSDRILDGIGINITLVNVEKFETLTNVEICAQLPDTQDWNMNGVLLSAGEVQSTLSGMALGNSKDANTYLSSYRCYVLEFPVGVDQYGDASVKVSISNLRVPAENNLEANCARASEILSVSNPGLTFTCGPAGFYYTNPKLPAGMDLARADVLIMDALEQAIYGYWLLQE